MGLRLYICLGGYVSTICLGGDRWHALHGCMDAYCMVVCNITTICWFAVCLGGDVSIVCLEGGRWHALHSFIDAYCMVSCNITTIGWFEVDYFSVF